MIIDAESYEQLKREKIYIKEEKRVIFLSSPPPFTGSVWGISPFLAVYLLPRVRTGGGEAMEAVKLWGGRVYSAKQPSPSPSSSSMRGPIPCSGGEEYRWEYFPCPFCYVDVEVPVLCSHLQEEHCFDTRNTVCPLCADNKGKDMIDHFSVHHSHMLKRRKSQRTSPQPATIENEHEVNTYYEALITKSQRDAPDPIPDPLFSSFISNLPFPDPKHKVKDNDDSTASGELVSCHERRLVSSSCNKTTDENYDERSCRAEFVQELVFSTIL